MLRCYFLLRCYFSRFLQRMMFVFVAGLLTAGVTARTAVAGDWPGFRGPNGNGITEEKNLPTEWSEKKNVKWFFKLPGPGNSSPIVSAGRVFITCAEENGRRRHLYCIDRRTGEGLWVRTVTWNKPEKMHRTNPYCGSTPAANGKVVVVWHGSAGLYCYDFSGREKWKADLGPFTHIWGYGSSPVIHGDKVFLNAGPGRRQFLIALDLKTGKTLWKRDEPGGTDTRNPRMVGSWSTPVIVRVDGKEQLLCSLPTRVVALHPENGDLLWEVRGLDGPNGDLVYTSLVVGNGVGVAMAGYTGPMVAFKLGGRGDVTARNTLWRSKGPQPQRIGSGVIVGDSLYIANADSGTAHCYALKTGQQRWRARVGGGAHWGSLVLADGKFYVTGKSGITFVFRPNPKKFDLIAKNQLPGQSNSTPALSDGEIFLRTFRGVYCISTSPAE